MSSNTPLATPGRAEKRNLQEDSWVKKAIRHNSSQILTVSNKTQMKLWLSLPHFSPKRMDEVSRGFPSAFRWERTSRTFVLLNLPGIPSRERCVSHPDPRARAAPGGTSAPGQVWTACLRGDAVGCSLHWWLENSRKQGWVVKWKCFVQGEKFQVHRVQFNSCPRRLGKGQIWYVSAFFGQRNRMRHEASSRAASLR